MRGRAQPRSVQWKEMERSWLTTRLSVFPGSRVAQMGHDCWASAGWATQEAN
jgi:hypothetical protein